MFERLVEWLDEVYPQWRATLQRATRTFVVGFLGTLGVLLEVVDVKVLLSLDSLKLWLITLLFSAVAGGLVALGKYLRDTFPKSKTLKKLPI